MQTADWNQGITITPDELPAAVTDYLAAHRARALDAAIAHYTADAIVTDEGHDYHGPDEIRAWLARSASEYTYTIELTAAAERTTSISTRSTTWKVISPAARSTCISGSPCAAR